VTTENSDKKTFITINFEECKACGRCVEACPINGLKMSDQLNEHGYHYVEFVTKEDCIGCASCYYTCPEPFAIEVHVVGK